MSAPHDPSDAAAERPANRLAGETSPYLLQHAHNPVDWYPFGPAALERARSEDKPIFLSIGYSACHWCHVMERESFESEGVARLMNEHFVNVKVDREERPDLDDVYMSFVQRTTGRGGWPMSVFLTPELEPFYGGTYFPPVPRHGLPSFPQLLQALAQKWASDRATLVEHGARMARTIAAEGAARTVGDLDPALLDRSLEDLTGAFDAEWGGFGGAPKFPHATDVRLMLRHHLRTGSESALHVVRTTLDRMAEGGLHDQLGGGFHRYSVDERWLVPHFEKMLYDNALLVVAYLEAHAALPDAGYDAVARRACDWMLREMTTPEGGLASAQDADSEGEEGTFFVWTPGELDGVLGAESGRRAAEWWGVTDEGNFERGASVPWRHEADEVVAARLKVDIDALRTEMERAREALFAERERRARPATDDKVLASWNGLAISALAKAAQVLEEPRYRDAGARAAEYVLTAMRQPDGRLHATARHGRAHLNAYLDDYVFVAQGLVDLYETDFDERRLREALALCDVVRERFADRENGGYFTTGEGHERLIARLKGAQDGALPSGHGVHALTLLRLAALTGRADLAEEAEATIRSVAELANRFPPAFSALLLAVDAVAVGMREVVLSGERDDPALAPFLRAVRRHPEPHRVVALASRDADAALLPLVEGRRPDGAPRAFVCRDRACDLPANDPGTLSAQLAQ